MCVLTQTQRKGTHAERWHAGVPPPPSVSSLALWFPCDAATSVELQHCSTIIAEGGCSEKYVYKSA